MLGCAMAPVIPIDFVKFRHNHPPFGKRFREFRAGLADGQGL